MNFLGFIEAMQGISHDDKMLAKIIEINLEEVIEFLKILTIIEFNQQKDYQETYNTTKIS